MESIESIINAHPESVRLLLKSYGLNKQSPTVQDVKDAGVLFGEPFMLKLYEIGNPSLLYSNFEDKVKAEKKKGQGWDKFKNLVTKVSGAAQTASTLLKVFDTNVANRGELNAKKEATIELEKAEDKKTGKTAIIAGIILVVVIIIVIIVIKTKNKW